VYSLVLILDLVISLGRLGLVSLLYLKAPLLLSGVTSQKASAPHSSASQNKLQVLSSHTKGYGVRADKRNPGGLFGLFPFRRLCDTSHGCGQYYLRQVL
jgi:hypothetical protein